VILTAADVPPLPPLPPIFRLPDAEPAKSPLTANPPLPPPPPMDWARMPGALPRGWLPNEPAAPVMAP
jgi:hypothetical protein